jgi:hypothetical protein
VPSEVYLREFKDTDVSDLESLAELCRVGVIRAPDFTPPERDLELPGIQVWQYTMSKIAAAYNLPCPADIDAERMARFDGDSSRRFPIHAAEAIYRVLMVQQCTEHVRAYLTGQPVHEVWEACNDERSAWNRFTEITRPALQDFHVRVEIQAGDQPSDDFDIGRVRSTLYGVAMLQLVNDLGEAVHFVKCANETCGRLFARQRGRTQYGGHRMEGVLYCSSTCARAQYQREKRRRDKAARGRRGNE